MIVTKGFGTNQMIVTRGYGTLTVIEEAEEVKPVSGGGVGYLPPRPYIPLVYIKPSPVKHTVETPLYGDVISKNIDLTKLYGDIYKNNIGAQVLDGVVFVPGMDYVTLYGGAAQQAQLKLKLDGAVFSKQLTRFTDDDMFLFAAYKLLKNRKQGGQYDTS